MSECRETASTRVLFLEVLRYGLPAWLRWTFDWINRADMLTTWFDDTVSRRDAGVLYPYNFYNLDPVLITHVTTPPQSFTEQYLQFMLPFTWPVWGLVAAMWFVIALGAAYIEGAFSLSTLEREGSSWKEYHVLVKDVRKYFELVFHTAYAYMAQGGWMDSIEIKTRPGYSLALIFQFATVVLMASYTANMAGILSTKPTPVPGITSLEDLVAKGGRVCYKTATEVEVIIGQLVENRILHHSQLFAIDQDFSLSDEQRNGDANVRAMNHLRAGDCIGYALPENLAEEAMLGAGNYKCDMQIVYPPFDASEGGYAMPSTFSRSRALGGPNSSGPVCVDAVQNIMSTHFKRLLSEPDRPITTARIARLRALRENSCPVDASHHIAQSQSGVEALQIKLSEMWTLFVFVGIGGALLVVIAIIARSNSRVACAPSSRRAARQDHGLRTERQ